MISERTDRELLMLAAKAAGIAPDKSSTNGGGAGNTGFDILGNLVLDWHDGITWNPLEDDGDALRLAVKLDIEVEPVPFSGRAIVRDDDYGEQFDEESSDRMAATRRAIVRAAAAMAEGGEQ